MAAAIIPLIAGLAPSIIDLIVSLIHPKAEAVEGLGTGTGAVKFADVFTSVMADLAKAHAAGSIVGVLPDDATVKVILQSVISSMKLSGQLGGTPTTPTIGTIGHTPQSITLMAGQSLLITA